MAGRDLTGRACLSTTMAEWGTLGAVAWGRSMTVENDLDTSKQPAVGGPIEEADALVTERRADIPSGFVDQLFARAAPEDLARYTASDLAQFAMDAWALLAKRTPGAPRIRFVLRARAGNDPRRSPIPVPDIINDDMPFLVDSVLGELTERRGDVCLVVAPIFSVGRDPEGSPVAFPGAGPPARAPARPGFLPNPYPQLH